MSPLTSFLSFVKIFIVCDGHRNRGGHQPRRRIRVNPHQPEVDSSNEGAYANPPGRPIGWKPYVGLVYDQQERQGSRQEAPESHQAVQQRTPSRATATGPPVVRGPQGFASIVPAPVGLESSVPPGGNRMAQVAGGQHSPHQGTDPPPELPQEFVNGTKNSGHH